MKKYFSIIIAVVLVQQAFAGTFYSQLCAFNSNWKKYPGRIADEEARYFYSDKDYIQAHLDCVLKVLRSNPVNELSAAQYSSRIHLIGLLESYRAAGNFPINYYRHERIPVFIDRNQTHCAVGYLMLQTGDEEMALRIANADNYAWVKDIHDSGVIRWQQASGFTLEELKLIQGAYDFYRPDAMFLPDKYEIPQKPACITTYFKTGRGAMLSSRQTLDIWCKGEGANGLLNGRWEQNYSPGIPWIVGYFNKGKKCGQWMEYYQGTNLLCRTENWRDDKLNGLRRRFDKAGNLTEVILFKDGKAVTKTNYDLQTHLTWIRKPLDSAMVYTEVYNSGGGLLAAGNESVYNPGNLMWFQNIELTALNYQAVSAKAMLQPAYYPDGNIKPGFARSMPVLFNKMPLVTYKKEGNWTYFKEYGPVYLNSGGSGSGKTGLNNQFSYFSDEIIKVMKACSIWFTGASYDSVKLDYADDVPHDFYGFGKFDLIHLHINYYEPLLFVADNDNSNGTPGNSFRQEWIIKEAGLVDQEGNKTGTWKYFDANGSVFKLRGFPMQEKRNDDEEKLSGILPVNNTRKSGWRFKK